MKFRIRPNSRSLSVAEPEPYLFHVFLFLPLMFLWSLLFPKHHTAAHMATPTFIWLMDLDSQGVPGVLCARSGAVGSASRFPFPLARREGRRGCCSFTAFGTVEAKCPLCCGSAPPTPYLHTTLVERVDEERLAVRAQVSVLLGEMVSELQQLLFLPGICLVRRW